MARQRSGSSSSRNSRGPRGARPASTRPGRTSPAQSAAASPPAAAEVEEPAVETEVEETEAATVEETEAAAKTPVSTSKKPPVEEPVAVVEEDEDEVDVDPVEVDDEVDIDPVEADVEADEADEAELDEDDLERVAAAAELWSEVRIAPVEIALPRGVGYTLRAYRMSDELAAVEVDEREDEFEGFLDSAADEDDDELAAEAELVAALGLEAAPPVRTKPKRDRDDDLDVYDVDEDEDEEDDEDEDDDDLDALDDDDLDLEADEDEEDDEDEDEDDEEDDDDPEASADDNDEEDDEDDDDEVEVKPAAEEVPVFLGRRGKVYVFASAEGLVEFVRASDDHDLAQLDTWADLKERLTADDIVPEPADKYELDLVVENLRGGADSLDYGLLIQAGEAARDLAFATRLEPVIAALAPGSPLDDLDEAVRAADASGGIRGFMAKRKLRKIVTQQTALGWRTIIGKISSVVDWRE